MKMAFDSKGQLPTESKIIGLVKPTLSERLPSGWSLQAVANKYAQIPQFDLPIRIISPDGESSLLAIDVKRTVEPRNVPKSVAHIWMLCSQAQPPTAPIIAAAYLSPRSRELLEQHEIGYIDTTGNIRIDVSRPGLFISAEGADRDPWPQDDELQSLRGRGAACAVRAIVEHAPPFGVRELASNTRASAPTLSRVLELLEREFVAFREPRGPVLQVNWVAAIRRWARDYGQTRSNAVTTFYQSRGFSDFRSRLNKASFTYAATGAFAAQHVNPPTQAETATVYVEDAIKTANELGLQESDSDFNVTLLEPFDPIVFDRTIWRRGLRCVAPSQLCVDLLTGPGREPALAEQMIQWMKRNTDDWQS